jgi:hypothetical protein
MQEEKSVSRLLPYTDKKCYNDDGTPKEGEEYVRLHDCFGFTELGVIVRWHNGFLHGEGDLPAAEFEDTHTEYWKNGRLSRRLVGMENERIPAVISNYSEITEYWEDGKRIEV